MGGSTKVSYPGPTPQETQLQDLQLQSLEQQQQDITSFKPFVLQQYGLQDTNPMSQDQRDALGPQVQKAKSDMQWWQSRPDGFVEPTSGTTKAQGLASTQAQLTDLQNQVAPKYDYTPEQKARNVQLQAAQDEALKLQGLQSARQEKALNGTLPLSQQLIQQRDLDFKTLQEDQAKNGNEIMGDNLDNAVAKTTSGGQALESLRKTYGLLANNEQNAAISQAALPGVYAQQYQTSSQNANPGAPNYAAMYAPFQASITSAYGPYMAQQQGQFQAGSINAQNNQSLQNTLLTGLLNGGAKVAGAYAGGA